MRRFSELVVVAGFAAFLFVPLALTIAGTRIGSTDENRVASDRPPLGLRELFDAETYVELDGYLSDRFSLRGVAIRLNARLNDLVWKGDSGEVRRGRDGWLYYVGSFDALCGADASPEEAVQHLDRFVRTTLGRGARVRVAVAPAKTSVYPEHLSETLAHDATCAMGARDRITEALAAPSRDWNVDLYGPLRDAKAATTADIYLARDTHWSELGAVVFVEELVTSLEPGLWDAGDIVVGSQQFVPDLTRLLGVPQEVTAPDVEIRRPGVRTSQIEERPVDGTFPIRRFRSTTDGPGLVVGRTVMVHDSFAVPAFDLLAPYFSDITYVHWDVLQATDDAARLLEGADTVLVEVAERIFIDRMTAALVDGGLVVAAEGSGA